LGDELDKSQGRIGDLFDSISPSYDRLNHILSLSIDVGWRERTLDELAIREGDAVLDIATGTGDLAIAAASRVKASVIGLDLSRGMMGTAMKKWEEAFDGGYFQVVQGDALQMPFSDASFDREMVAFGIRNMPDMGAFLDEAHRVLRPEGRLAVLELSVPDDWPFSMLYLLYLTKILPTVGGWVSGEHAAYKYLAESIQSLPAPKELESLYEKHRFKVVRSIPLTRGICHLYVLEKPRE